MGRLKEYRSYLDGIKTAVPEINKLTMLQDPSEWTKHMNGLSSADNLLMCGIVPSFGNNSPRSVDEFQTKVFGEILVVKKVDVSAESQDGYIDAFDDTLIAVEKVKDILLEDHSNGCNIMRKLQPESVQVVPFSTSQAKGWNLIFTFDLWI